jgi:hypothetical protein
LLLLLICEENFRATTSPPAPRWRAPRAGFRSSAQSQRVAHTQARLEGITGVVMAAGNAAVLQVQTMRWSARAHWRHGGEQWAAYAGGQGAEKTAPRFRCAIGGGNRTASGMV